MSTRIALYEVKNGYLDAATPDPEEALKHVGWPLKIWFRDKPTLIRFLAMVEEEWGRGPDDVWHIYRENGNSPALEHPSWDEVRSMPEH